MAVNYKDIVAAAGRISGQIRHTPLLESLQFNARIGGRVLVKAEPLQYTGAFKFRGACNAIACLGGCGGVGANIGRRGGVGADKGRCGGVGANIGRRGGVGANIVAYSSGNHGAAVAAAAVAQGFKAHIVMPQDAPVMKINNTKNFGGEVVLYDRYQQSREDIAAALAKTQNAEIIPPYDDARVIAGQGTLGLEIAADLKARGIKPHQLICPTGGGGLLAGTALALHENLPNLDIIAAEPEGFDDFARSLAADKRLANQAGARSICDSIVTPMPGEITFPINRQHVSGGVAVREEDVLKAMASAWQDFKLVTEPGGAVALAALLSGAVKGKDKVTIIIASGGNVDAELFRTALKRL